MHPPATECTLFILMLAGGCTSSPKRPASPVPAGGIVAPVTYSGVLPWPCADCPGIHPTLTLFPDSTFRLRQVYQEPQAVFHHLGRWSVDEKDKRLVLRSGSGAPQLFQVEGTDSLRLVDTLGQPIGTEHNYWLVRSPQVDPVRDTMTLRGTYSCTADAGHFTECGSGLSFPVAQVGANADLERAYLGARTQPGGPLLVGFRGHFEEQPSMEGARSLEQLVVDRFDRVWPGANCERRMSNATLENTYWKLVEFGGEPARVAENIAEPHLLLHPATKQATGSTGCNRFSGPYELSGDSLRLGPLTSTRRACLDPEMNRQESTLLEGFDATRSWKTTDDTLVLSGGGEPVARFVAVYLR
jgi:copper homeostasis protein (lipoprotein)